MALNLLKDKGVPLAKQRFTWKELVQPFKQAYMTEQEHVQKVRTWVAAGQGRT